MATEKKSTDQPARHVYGPRPLGALLPAVTRAAYRTRPPATAQVMADWPVIVGPALAAVTAPRRLAAGTLTVGCAGPVAMELQHLAPQLIARINTHVGSTVVSRLRLQQDGGAASGPALPPRRDAKPTEAAIRAAERAVAGLPDGPLRDALASLGRTVLTARARRPS
jgi:hypothetical protein